MLAELKKNGLLTAPKSYWSIPECIKKKLCNGCGPSGNIFFDAMAIIIPDSLLGLDITEACNIHDFCCLLSRMDKKQTDNLFLDNMSALIDNQGGILRGARHIVAFHYWLAVRSWKP